MNARLCLIAASIMAAPFLQASTTLVQFDMETRVNAVLNSERGFDPSTVHPDIAASRLVMNNNITGYPVNVVGSYQDGNGNPLRVSTWATSVAQSAMDLSLTLSNQDYIHFTVTPEPGMMLNLTGLTFGAGAPNHNNVRAFHVFSSVTGFDVDDRLYWNGNSPAGGTLAIRNSGNLFEQSVVLTGAQFQNVVDPVQFRIYFHTGLANQELDFGGMTLTGSVSVIPEPSTYALLIAGVALGLAILRRRRAA
jgi:hypothetical protein